MLPESSGVPPEAAAYQLIVSPVPGIADKVSDPVPQMLALVPVGGNGAGNIMAMEIPVLLPAAAVLYKSDKAVTV